MKKVRKYDTGLMVTCQAQKTMQHRNDWTGGDTDYQDRFEVYWGRTAVAGAYYGITLASAPEFNAYSQLYRSYKVKGVKIKWIPDDVTGKS